MDKTEQAVPGSGDGPGTADGPVAEVKINNVEVSTGSVIDIDEKVLKLKGNILETESKTISETENRNPVIDSVKVDEEVTSDLNQETVLVNGEGPVQNGHIDSPLEKFDDTDTKKVEDIHTNKKKVKDIDTEKKKVEDIDTDQKKVEDTDSDKKKVEDIDTDKKKVEDIDTDKKKVEDIDTDKKKVEDIDTNKEKVEDIDTDKKKVEDIDTDKKNIEDIDTDKKNIEDTDTDKKVEIEDKETDTVEKECVADKDKNLKSETDSKSDIPVGDDIHMDENVVELNGSVTNESESVTNEEEIKEEIKEPDKVIDYVVSLNSDPSLDKSVGGTDVDSITENKTENSLDVNDTGVKTEDSLVESLDVVENVIENNKITEPLTECKSDCDDKKETNCASVSVSETQEVIDEGPELKDQTVELDQIPGELVECNNSNSSGMPSLVKEVLSEDNSVKSDTDKLEIDKLEEPMITEDSDELKKDNQTVETMLEPVKTVTDSNKKDDTGDKVVTGKAVGETEMASVALKTDEKGVGTEEHVSVPSKPATKVLSSKSEKLDRLLSKITNKAESNCQKVLSSTQPQKQAKARKSCANSSSLPSKSNQPPSLTSLTFNVKELEKKGVLDMPKPKPSKRKAFEPIKIPSPDKDKQNSPPKKLSPLKSPVKSPGKNDNPFFKKQKLLTRRKKKSKRSGGYKLPGEKVWKRTKSKRSEERQLKSETGKMNTSVDGDSHSSVMSVEENMTTSSVSYVLPPGQTNAFDLLTKNSSKSSMAANSSKKAKKTVKGIDPLTHRTLDNFLKTGSHAARKFQDGSEKTEYLTSIEQRKRKASNDKVLPVLSHQTYDASRVSPDEKKRRTEVPNSPPPSQMITLVPTGSPPVAMPTSAQQKLTSPGNGNQILLSPGVPTSGQTLIQNGTINGLPMFQLINNSTIASSQAAQFIIAQSQGRPILTSSSPRTTTLLQPNVISGVHPGMPLLLTPMPLSSVNGAPSQSTFKNSIPSVIGSQLLSATAPTQPTVQQQHTVLKNTLAMPRMQLPNGQFIDVKPKEGTVPNGLYPVTPPRTPEDQRSEAGTQDPGEEIEGVTGSVTPDKDVIPLCTCKISGASFQKVTTLVTFCQALDSVDGQVLGCCNKVTNPQLVRPSVKIPFLALCDSHRKRLRLHQCCPGCGHFCTQGKFLQCKKDGSSFIHNFHEQCQVTKNGKNYCPHCGETSNQYEVHLSLPDPKVTVAKDIKANRTQSKARIGVLDRRSASSGEDTCDDAVVTHLLEKSKKVLSTADIPVGPDRYSLERVLSCLGSERPKKYRHLPKCLYTPAYDNDLERVVYMLEDAHDPNELYDDLEGQSALHAAAAIGSLCIVHVLVQAGASPHHQDKTLRTPLMFAAENNHPDVVKYLVKANAIIDAKADDGMTALHLAAKAGHVNIINLLLDTDRLDIDVTDDGGWTPLIWAAEHTEVEAVRVLLQRKADPNLRDSEENTTMHWAAFSGSVAIAELLLAAGCDLDSLNMHGDRPLHIAARQDHYDLVVVFLARGADVEAKNNKGETPLECCIEQNTAVYLALKVNKQLKSFGAKHMGKPDKLIHRDLSKGRENIPIPCVNGVDDEGEPRDYLYVTDNIETTCLNINRVIGSLQTCQCKDDCSSIYCACGKNSIRCWYDKYNRLIPEFNMLEPPLIFECNRACECWTTCNNRVVQNGVMSRLQVFKTVGRGWGCKTLVDIARGTFICEYIGEHISDSEADRREDDSYLFDLDNRDGETYCIDARKFGNVARFINHLCEPNLTPVKVFVDSQDLRFPRICLFANRDIKAQEELGFDYGEKFWIIKWKQFTCTCGSPKCRYSTDTIQKTLEEYRLRHEIDDTDSQE